MTWLPKVTWLPLLMASLCASMALIRMLVGMSEKVRQSQTLTHLKQLGTVTMQYAQNNEERLPPLQNLQQLQRAIGPQKENLRWQSSGWELPFATNPALSEKYLPELDNLSQLVIVYEPLPLWVGGNESSQRLRGVVFADGHAKLVRPDEWKRVRRLSQLEEGSAPIIAPWWQPGAKGPKEPISDALSARLWAGGYVLLALVGAALRRRSFLTGTALYLLVTGSLGMLGFLALVNLGKSGVVH